MAGKMVAFRAVLLRDVGTSKNPAVKSKWQSFLPFFLAKTPSIGIRIISEFL